ncbi:MAG: hypothetical protein KKF41_01080 [Actinobacteria bacterium]|nr:hypothetical protein [Actinomycetota bacterium]MBU1943697.1 hypothetical protein [Actinomycetota bacterium]MBU2686159.1 hypothetical protein [Actinomycetota bacterium]
MKKCFFVITVAVVLAGLAIGLAGCGPNAETIAKNAMRAEKDIKTVHFEVSSTVKLPRAPIQEGQVAKQEYVQASEGDIDLETGNYRVKTELTPGVPITAMQVGDKLYTQVAGNWYEMPASFQLPAPVTQSLSISQYLKYFKSLTKEGNSRVEGEACYHLKAVPDMEELIKLPGITDLLKDSSGNQVRTVDELKDLKATFDFYIRVKDYYFKMSAGDVEVRATEDIIKQGYAEPGDKVTMTQEAVLSDYNAKLNLAAPASVKPWPGQ